MLTLLNLYLELNRRKRESLECKTDECGSKIRICIWNGLNTTKPRWAIAFKFPMTSYNKDIRGYLVMEKNTQT